jgi:hypothetical protein
MPAGLPVALAFFAQAAAQAYGPAAPAAAKPVAAPVKPAERSCAPGPTDPDSREIVVCAPKPQGYRIDPDVLAAKRAKKQAQAGRPRPPNMMKDHSCAVVGPAPCMDAPMINLLAAAATAAEMAERLSKGQEIGSMFVTDPQPSEYQLYLEAKRAREAKEAEAAAKAKAAAKAAQAPPAAPKP